MTFREETGAAKDMRKKTIMAVFSALERRDLFPATIKVSD